MNKNAKIILSNGTAKVRFDLPFQLFPTYKSILKFINKIQHG